MSGNVQHRAATALLPREVAAIRHRPTSRAEMRVAVAELFARGLSLESIARATALSLESVADLVEIEEL